MSTPSVNDNNFANEVLSSSKPAMVDFWADWCGPCKPLGKIIDSLFEKYKNANIRRVNVDENPGIGIKYQIKNIPRTLFFEKGQVVDKQIGLVEQIVYEKKLETLIHRFEQEIVSNLELVALTSIDGKLRLISFNEDGEIRFLDEQKRKYDILYTRHFESFRLKQLIQEFEYLINYSNTKEKDLQDFFIRNQDFIINDEYKAAHPHIVLDHKENEYLIPDFILEPIQRNGLADLLELKLPKSKIFILKKNRAHFSSAIIEAAAQLRTYNEYFDSHDNRTRVLDKYGLNIFKPRMILVIGRKGNIDPFQIRRMESDVPNLVVKTYDDILQRMKNKI